VQLNSKLNKISVGIMAWTNLFFGWHILHFYEILEMNLHKFHDFYLNLIKIEKKMPMKSSDFYTLLK
jgi:hypothetical protein